MSNLSDKFDIGYLWKNPDGTEPEEQHYYDSTVRLNTPFCSFTSEEQALKGLDDWYKEYPHTGPYILVKTYDLKQ